MALTVVHNSLCRDAQELKENELVHAREIKSMKAAHEKNLLKLKSEFDKQLQQLQVCADRAPM